MVGMLKPIVSIEFSVFLNFFKIYHCLNTRLIIFLFGLDNNFKLIEDIDSTFFKSWIEFLSTEFFICFFKWNFTFSFDFFLVLFKDKLDNYNHKNYFTLHNNITVHNLWQGFFLKKPTKYKNERHRQIKPK